MKILLHLFFIGFVFSIFSCNNEKVSQNAVELSVDFTWEGIKQCRWGNPEIHVNGIPEKTKFLKISMYDHEYAHDHGTVKMPYSGVGIIEKDRFKEIQGPCPPLDPVDIRLRSKPSMKKRSLSALEAKKECTLKKSKTYQRYKNGVPKTYGLKWRYLQLITTRCLSLASDKKFRF